MKVYKRLFTLLFVLMLALVLSACKRDNKLTIEFDGNGGTVVVKSMKVDKNTTIPEPEDPVREGYVFTGWYLDKKLSKAFDFSKPFTEDMTGLFSKKITLYAGWSDGVVVRFSTRTNQSIPTEVLPDSGGIVQEPPTPTKEGFRFGGWFRGRAGLTWLDPEPVQFPLEVTEGLALYAYWEPVDSKAVTWSKAETYTSSILSSTPLVLNPLVYQYSHEDELIDMMVTQMYQTEVDWEKAIKDGVADFVGDFSKIIARDYSIEQLDFHYILMGATRFPIDKEGNEHLTPDGRYDRDNASKVTSDEWTFHIRNDLKFEDGTPITAATFEYSLKQYLDPFQNNYRSTIFYQDNVEKNGYPILNAAEYRKQCMPSDSGENGDEKPDVSKCEITIPWEDVGFEVIDDYTFKVTFWKPISQAQAVGFANDLRLVHPEKYEASLNDAHQSTYGTPDSPYVSYGPYIIKSWDENQKLVLNKNYDYVGKHTVNYKSHVIEIVDSISTATQLFKEGTLSVLGLSNENYAEFAEHENLKRGFSGYPQYITINLAGSRKEKPTHKTAEILYDKRFRQALFYGFDRNYYNANVYAPNIPSILPIPSDAKAYLQDPLLFNESPQHKSILQKHGIDPDTNGYIPERAKQLFDAAYEDWLAAGNSGPVVVKLLASNATPLEISLAEFIRDNYERLFNGEGYNPDNPSKFKLEIVWGNNESVNQRRTEWEFDLTLLNVGFGRSYGAQWQYPFIAFLGADLGGADLGLTQPYDNSGEPYGDWDKPVAEFLKREIEVDLTNTYKYLKDFLADTDPQEDNVHETYWELLEKLEAQGDKKAGIYKGDLAWLAQFNVDETPWNETTAEPFSGAITDIWNMLAAFEDVFFDYVPMIPTSTRATATVYQSNVVILWPQYSTGFGWGAARYRYLNTDPNFLFGMYNAYEAEYRASNK